jgi:prepilin-type processing-associated H-X9-DG protein
MPYGRRYDKWDSYTWSQNVLPYIEQGNVYKGYTTLQQTGWSAAYPSPNGPAGNDANMRASRHTVMSVFLCPSDNGPMQNETTTTDWGFIRGNYRGCTSTGDMYGASTDATTGPWGLGVFGVLANQSDDPGATPKSRGARFAQITDGTSNTLVFSEGIVPIVSGWGGPIGSIIYGNMGGALFTASLTPNSTSPDQVIGPFPSTQGDATYPTGTCTSIGGNSAGTQSAVGAQVAARSRHTGGVNASMADGTVRFFSNGTTQAVWRALGTRAGGESNTNAD